MKDEKRETITLNKSDLWKYSAFVILGILVFGMIFVFSSKSNVIGNVVNQPNPANAAGNVKIEVEIGDSPTLGKKNAPVTIVEFSDYQCSFCRKFWQETFPQIKQNYVDTGKVRFVYRDFPSDFHEGAIPYAEAANCAREKGGDEAYFKMHDKIFEEQNVLDGGVVKSTIPYVGADTLKKWAKDIGLNTAKFNTCLDTGKFAKDVQDDFAYGQSIGVKGTPTFFINGRLVSGAQPFSTFKQVIDAEL